MFREEGDSLLLLSAEDPTLIFLCQPELHSQAAAPRPPPLKTDALKLDSLTCPAGGDSFGCKEMSDR